MNGQYIIAMTVMTATTIHPSQTVCHKLLQQPLISLQWVLICRHSVIPYPPSQYALTAGQKKDGSRDIRNMCCLMTAILSAWPKLPPAMPVQHCTRYNLLQRYQQRQVCLHHIQCDSRCICLPSLDVYAYQVENLCGLGFQQVPEGIVGHGTDKFETVLPLLVLNLIFTMNPQ